MSAQTLLDFTLQATAVLGVVWLVQLLAPRRRTSAALRHWAWTVAFTGVLLLPVATLAAPGRLQVSLFGAQEDGARIERLAASADEVPASLAPAHARSMDKALVGTTRVDAIVGESSVGVPLSSVLIVVWLTGACGVLLWTLAQLAGLTLLARGARPVRRAGRDAAARAGWTAALERARRRLGVRRRVELRVGARVPVPMAVGVLRPRVLLPEAALGWAPERRDVVLLHELVHVGRGDVAAQLVARLACALAWHVPLAWLALARLRLERERACDDRVLAQGTEDVEYASHLLGIARGLRRLPWPVPAAVSMARRSELSERVRSILSERDARAEPGARLRLWTGLCALALLVPLGAAHVAPRPLEALVLEELLERVESERPELRAAVATFLGRAHGIAALDELEVLIRDEDPAVRRACGQALGELARREGFYVLLPSAGDPDPAVRATAVWALGRIGCDPAFVAVSTSLDDPAEAVRAAAAEALLGFDGRLYDRTLPGVARPFPSHTRRALRAAVGEAPVTSAREALRAAERDPVPAVRAAASRTLSRWEAGD